MAEVGAYSTDSSKTWKVLGASVIVGALVGSYLILNQTTQGIGVFVLLMFTGVISPVVVLGRLYPVSRRIMLGTERLELSLTEMTGHNYLKLRLLGPFVEVAVPLLLGCIITNLGVQAAMLWLNRDISVLSVIALLCSTTFPISWICWLILANMTEYIKKPDRWVSPLVISPVGCMLSIVFTFYEMSKLWKNSEDTLGMLLFSVTCIAVLPSVWSDACEHVMKSEA